MSQNPFGQPTFGAPQQPASAEPMPVNEPQEKNAAVRKWALIGGVAVLTGAVALGAIKLTAGGDDEDLTAAPATARPAVASTPATTEAPVPLPTLAEFNGRNPFKAKIVEGTGGSGGGATTAPTGTSSTSGTGGTGSTGGSWTGGGSTGGFSLPGKDGADGKDGKDGSAGRDGANGENGQDAGSLYALLIDVDKDGRAFFALGAGLDFKVYTGQALAEGENLDGKLYELDAEGKPVEAGVPGSWVRVLSLENGEKGDGETPAVELEDDGTVGDTATIVFGDQTFDLIKWEPKLIF